MAKIAAGPRGQKKKATATRKRVASRAAEKAKVAGAVGRYGPREQRAIRNAGILARHHASVPHKAIASEFGVSERTVRLVVQGFRELPSPLDETPMDIVEELVKAMRAEVGELQAMAVRTEERFPAVALGAKKAALEARRDYIGLLMDLGKLPENLELFRAQSELDRIMRRMVEVLEEVAQGRISGAEAQEELDRLLSPSTSLYVDGQAWELPPGPAEGEGSDR